MDADGGNPTRLTDSPGFDGFPLWSPDGRKIAFLTGRDGNAEIYTMNPDGSEQTNLTNTPNAQESVQGDFSWSPDSAQIMFHTNRDNNVEIYVMDANGDNPTNLSNNPGIDFASIWVP
jgi:TolB protein